MWMPWPNGCAPLMRCAVSRTHCDERALLDQLPNLKLISQRSVYPHVDVDACNRNGILLCSNMVHGDNSFAAPELTWALIMAAMRKIPQQMNNMRSGNWQLGVGKTIHGRTLGLYGYGRIAKIVEGYAKAFGMNVVWWGSEDGRARAAADGKTIAESREAFLQPDVVSVHVRLKPATKGMITPRIWDRCVRTRFREHIHAGLIIWRVVKR